MTIDSDKILHDLLNSLDSLEGIRPRGENPEHLLLYMDQVTTFMDAQLASSRRFESDKVLTKTMINNYAKKTAATRRRSKKKYSPEHMMLLDFYFTTLKTSSRSRISRHCSPRSPIGISARRAAFPSKISTDEIFQMEKEEIASVKEDLLKKRMYPSPCSAAHRRRTGNFSSSFRLSVC